MKSSNTIFYLGTLFFSALFLFIGSRIAIGEGVDLDTKYNKFWFEPVFMPAVITEIRVQPHDGDADQAFCADNFLNFEARITSGDLYGQYAIVARPWGRSHWIPEEEPQVGDRVLLLLDEEQQEFYFMEFIRINYVVILAVVFFALVLLFGRKKGFNAIIALGFICIAVFFVLVPAILSGRNIYAVTVIVCIYAIMSTLLLVIGPNRKTLASIIGCLGGVILAGLLMLFMDIFLRLTMFMDDDTSLLLWIVDTPIEARSLVFAGVTIGALGAIMDVAMSIASSLWELKEAGGVSDFKTIFKSGINIGRDILGTMLNTLILAYIGSSLSMVLVSVIWTPYALYNFNSQLIIVELVRALVGSFGMLLAIPLTAWACGMLYSRENQSIA